MKSFIPKTSKSVTLIAFLFVFLSSLFVFQVHPTQAEDPHTEMVWVLTETQVNPYDGQLEFYGGGATPGFFGEARFEGKFVKYAVTETSFRIDDRHVDHEYEYHNVTIETYFEKPPLKLTPGETIELILGFSHSGTAEDGGIGVQFWYDSEDVDIQPDTVFAYAPWAESFDGTTDGTYSFEVPSASSGSEIEIYASWWNAEPCLVIWKYQAQEVSGAADEEVAPDQVEEPVLDDPVQEVGQGRELGEAECARMQQEVADQAGIGGVSNESDLKLGIIGQVVNQHGSAVHDYCTGGEGNLSEGGLIKIGDCIRTGSDGGLFIQMNDQNDALNAGPSIILVAADSEMCFDEFYVFANPVRHTTLMSLIKGALRAITKGWKNGSTFSVKAGTTICGGRGTEFFIQYNPDFDFVQALVIEGHMDVTSEATGETVSLYDNQKLVVTEGDIIDTGHVSQELWDLYLEEYGLRDADFPDAEIEEWESIEINTPPPAKSEDEIKSTQETRPPLAGYIFTLCGVLICGVALVTMLTIIYFRRKRSKR